uniref:Uncharacterized protein n=1 Tax=Octopus bimaculoides TaxID=37653 RepID=A0A0L8GVL7_OCTBM
MKLVLLFLVLLPIVFSASLYDEEVDKRLNVIDVINHIRQISGRSCVAQPVKLSWAKETETNWNKIAINSVNRNV